ncbi:hypothetical protein DFJ63DRAFT_312352 [Scheffersomyces coipomensis]|uniref:uncharacterized protein n=1 Tax=Scheffersomyces coipomensis TaxID=1788519 RepID=UPI00315DD649
MIVDSTKQTYGTEQYRIQDPSNVHTPLPNQFEGISKLVLQVDTTLNDVEELLLPELSVHGLLLKHNISDYTIPIPYEQSSQCFIDNAHKFDSNNPLVITLQFKLGINDNGTSMFDLLEKMNKCARLGSFKFKVYIYKSVGDEPCHNYKIPPPSLFKQLNGIIGFRFETDNIRYLIDYHDIWKEMLKISLGWLEGEPLEELYIGQRIIIIDDITHLYFPNLETIGFECKDYITSYNFSFFIRKHRSIIKNLVLRDFVSPIDVLLGDTLLENLTLIGYFFIDEDNITHFTTYVKTLTILGLDNMPELEVSNLDFKELIIPCNKENDDNEYKESIIAAASSEHFIITQIPSLPCHERHSAHIMSNYINLLYIYYEKYGEPIPPNLITKPKEIADLLNETSLEYFDIFEEEDDDDDDDDDGYDYGYDTDKTIMAYYSDIIDDSDEDGYYSDETLVEDE